VKPACHNSCSRCQNAALIIAFSVFGSFIKQHSEASGRIAGLAAQAEGAGDEFEEGVDEIHEFF